LPDNEPAAPELRKAQEVLIEGCHVLKLDVSAEQTDAFMQHLSLLLKWNATFNLTALSDPVAIVRLHFLDSLAIANLIHTVGGIMDVGSGAGFPGIPLKILDPSLALTLVEPRRKRANFLRQVIRTLRLEKVKIFEDRIERLNPPLTGMVSTVVARAVGDFEFLLRAAYRFLSSDGMCALMHGPKGEQTFSDLRERGLEVGFRQATLQKYQIPFGREQRTLLIFQR
jgi:16S rRNA (guanine527-N7)-methyltransferase